jgi:hypothetical protein
LISAGKFLSRNQASAIAIFPFDEVDKNNVSPSTVSASAIQAAVPQPRPFVLLPVTKR